MIKNHASAHWTGGLKDGNGTMTTKSGAIKDKAYSFKSRFEGDINAATNPEELIAAAHAGCFSMALSNILGQEGYTAKAIDTKATVTLEQIDGGFAITKVHLELRADVPDADHATLQDCADKAKAGCPVSKLLNAEITLETSFA